MNFFRSLDVRDCQGTLWAFYRRFDGEGLASFEGDLSLLQPAEIPGASSEETARLRRQTIEPRLDFIVIPITDQTVELLKRRLSSPGVMGNDGVVVHTQIESANELIFSACDNFHIDCTVVAASVPEEFLASLQSKGLIRSFGNADIE